MKPIYAIAWRLLTRVFEEVSICHISERWWRENRNSLRFFGICGLGACVILRRIQFRQGVVVVFCRTVYVDISSLRRLKCYRASTVAEAEYGTVGFLQRITRLKAHRFSDKRRSNYRHSYRPTYRKARYRCIHGHWNARQYCDGCNVLWRCSSENVFSFACLYCIDHHVDSVAYCQDYIGCYSNQIKFYLVTHYIYYVHFITSDVTGEIL